MQPHIDSIDTPLPDGPLGPWGEDLATAHLVSADGLRVVARNWGARTGAVRGELDVVAVDPGTRTLVVTEVKTRRSMRHGGPLAAVTHRKQAQVRRLTTAFLRDADAGFRRVRFDVVGVLVPPDGPVRLEHRPGVF